MSARPAFRRAIRLVAATGFALLWLTAAATALADDDYVAVSMGDDLFQPEVLRVPVVLTS